MNKDSQRWEIMELVELIGNLISSFSHENEIYNSLSNDFDNLQSLPDEQKEELLNKMQWHYTKMKELLERRRNAMRILKELAKEYDWEYWCLVKHAIASYQFAQELQNNDMDNLEYSEMAEETSKYMFECLSKFLWTEVVTCGRCLADELK